MRNANTNINDKIFYEQFLFPNTEEVYFFFNDKRSIYFVGETKPNLILVDKQKK